MFDDALTNTERQIEPAVGGIALLEVLYDTQGVKVVVEAPTMANQTLIQRALAGMSKGRMADIVDQRKRLRQIFIEP